LGQCLVDRPAVAGGYGIWRERGPGVSTQLGPIPGLVAHLGNGFTQRRHLGISGKPCAYGRAQSLFDFFQGGSKADNGHTTGQCLNIHDTKGLTLAGHAENAPLGQHGGNRLGLLLPNEGYQGLCPQGSRQRFEGCFFRTFPNDEGRQVQSSGGFDNGSVPSPVEKEEWRNLPSWQNKVAPEGDRRVTP